MPKGRRIQTEHLLAEEERGDIVQLATRVPRALFRELKIYSATEAISISELMTEAIQDLLVKRGAGQRPRRRAS